MGVAVSGTVLSTSLVAGVGSETSVRRHLGEVHGSVETARQIGHIDVEGELLVERLEDLILGVAGHEVQTGADVGLGAGGDEVELERRAAGRHTVCAAVVGTIERAVGSAGGGVRAQSRVPRIARVAVSVAARTFLSKCHR